MWPIRDFQDYSLRSPRRAGKKNDLSLMRGECITLALTGWICICSVGPPLPEWCLRWSHDHSVKQGYGGKHFSKSCAEDEPEARQRRTLKTGGLDWFITFEVARQSVIGRARCIWKGQRHFFQPDTSTDVVGNDALPSVTPIEH
jgi:hypothetical protein